MWSKSKSKGSLSNAMEFVFARMREFYIRYSVCVPEEVEAAAEAAPSSNREHSTLSHSMSMGGRHRHSCPIPHNK